MGKAKYVQGVTPSFHRLGAKARNSWATRIIFLTSAILSLTIVGASPTSAKATDTATISTVAGNGTAGLSGNGGPALQAELNGPCGLALDPHGNVLFSDTNNNVVRVLAESTGTFYGQAMTSGDVYGLAGTGVEGYKGNGKAPLKAQFDEPDGITVDSAGDVIISDTENEVIRYIPATTSTHFGIAMTAGDLYVIAGNTNDGFSGSGGPATKAAIGLDTVAGVVLDANGNLIITDGDDNVIWVVANSTGTFYGQAMTAGDAFIIAGNGNADYTGDGGPALAAALDEPEGIAIDSSGNLVFADDSNDVIRVVAEKTGTFYGKKMTTGDIYTIGPKSDANKLGDPEGLIIDPAGNIVFADAGNNIVYLLATSTGTDDGIAIKANKLYEVAGNGKTGDTGDGGNPQKAELNSPCAVATDSHGNLIIADGGNNVIRQVAP
jgi:secreted PhoX family phosphatase